MSVRDEYKCDKCGKVHEFFGAWLNCCSIYDKKK